MKTKKDFLYAAQIAWEALQQMGTETHATRSKLTIPLDNGCTVQFIWMAPKKPNHLAEQYKKPLPINKVELS